MPGPACELHSKDDYTRAVFLLIGGEKGSSVGKEWFEREEGKLAKESSRYREDRTFGVPAYSLVDPAKGHVELIILKGDLVVMIEFDAPGADLEKLHLFARRILENF